MCHKVSSPVPHLCAVMLHGAQYKCCSKKNITDRSGVLVPAPDLDQPVSAAPSCGGCYVVADVAGVVWYSQVYINTAATAVVGVAVGNGTRATRTSIIQNEAPFTIEPSELVSGDTQATTPLALTSIQYEPTVTVNGAVL